MFFFFSVCSYTPLRLSFSVQSDPVFFFAYDNKRLELELELFQLLSPLNSLLLFLPPPPSSPLTTPLQCLELANCSLSAIDMAYLANSLHSENLVRLDLSGHEVGDLFPNTFRKLLHRCSATLCSLCLEECGLEDEHLELLLEALAPCDSLQEFKILGNPLSWVALRRIFNMLAQRFPNLRYRWWK